MLSASEYHETFFKSVEMQLNRGGGGIYHQNQFQIIFSGVGINSFDI